MAGVWEFEVSLDTSCKCVNTICQILKIEIIYETIENCDINNNKICEEQVWHKYWSNPLP